MRLFSVLAVIPVLLYLVLGAVPCLSKRVLDCRAVFDPIWWQCFLRHGAAMAG